MGQPGYAFLDAKQVAELGARALEVFRDMRGRGSWRGEPDFEANATYDAALAMLVACSECIAHLRDPSLAPLAAELVDAIDSTDHPYYSWTYWATAGLRGLLRSGVVTAELEACVEHAHAHVRIAVAETLPIDTPDRLQKLMSLAADEDGEVSKHAKQRLTNVEIPFWIGKFSSDPFAGLTPKQAKTAKKPVETLCKLFEERWWDDEKKEAFFAAAAKLPPALEADVLGRATIGERFKYATEHPEARRLAELGEPGMRGLDMILATPKLDWQKQYLAGAFGEGLPKQDALRVLPGLLERACAATVDHAQVGSTAHSLATVVGKGWPTSVDPKPVLDAILARPKWTPYDPVASALVDALERSTCRTELLPRVEAAMRAGFPDKWSEIEGACKRWLGNQPKPAVRALAERTLDSGQLDEVGWALGVLLEGARGDAAAARARRFDQDPRTRLAMRIHHTEKLLPELRRELRDGKLDFPVAVRVVVETGSLFGGTFSNVRFAWLRGMEKGPVPHEARLLSGNDKLRRSYSKYLGEKRFRTSLTETEWESYRRTRDGREMRDEREWALALEALPYEEGWHPSDRAFFERAFAHARERRTGGRWDLLSALGALVVKKCGGAELALLDELRAISLHDPADESDFEKDMLRVMQNAMRERLGMPELLPHAEAGEAVETKAAKEDDWLEGPR